MQLAMACKKKTKKVGPLWLPVTPVLVQNANTNAAINTEDTESDEFKNE